MKIETLQSFRTVLATGSFAAAAQVLNLTPSAISLQMKQLEEYVGQPLFDRSTRRVVPTPFALQIAPSMATALGLLEALRKPRQTGVAGVLRLGVIPSIEKSALPRALRLLQTAHPALSVRLSLDVSPALVQAVKAGRLDAAAVIRPESGGSSRLAWTDLVQERFVLVAPAHAPQTTPADLLRHWPWIRYDSSLTGGRIAAAWVRKVAPDAQAGFEIFSIEAILAMVSEGLGVSVLPRPSGPLPVDASVRVVELGESAPTRQVALVCRRVDGEERRVRALGDAFVEAYGNGSGVESALSS